MFISLSDLSFVLMRTHVKHLKEIFRSALLALSLLIAMSELQFLIMSNGRGVLSADNKIRYC